MAQPMTHKEEIVRIVNLMKVVKIKEGESHNSYYKRLIDCGAQRSRAVLQILEKIIEETEDEDLIYEKYKEQSRERGQKRKHTNPERKHVRKEPEQQEMVLTEPEAEDRVYRFLYLIKTKFDLSMQNGRLEYARYATDVLRVLFRHGDSIYQYVPLVALETGFYPEILWEQIMKGEHTNV